MGRLDRLPGIDGENTTRRNVLVGTGYVFGGMVALGAAGGDPEEESDDGDDVFSAEDSDEEPEEEPEPEPEPEGEEEEDELTESEVETLFVVVVQQHVTEETDIDVTANHENGVFEVRIEGYIPDEEAVAQVLGATAGAYAGVVDQGFGGVRMHAELYNDNGEYAGEYRAESEWAVSYNNGEMGDSEYTQRVLDTIETADSA